MPLHGRIFLALAGIYLLCAGTFLLWRGGEWAGGLGASLIQAMPEPTVMTGVLVGEGVITHVRDGDTVEVRLAGSDVPVRLIGVDTPETVKPRTAVQCYGPEASAFTKGFAGATVRLYEDPSQDAYDTYGRMLAYVELADGRQLNSLLVEGGYAREYTYQRPYLYQQEFRQLERQAKDAPRGLWAACH